jgi:hypothetical protein
VANRKCRYCGSWFVPDPRVGKRQKACSIECQKLRKRENNRIYRGKNPECWEGHYEYVKQWRQKHPDYQRQWRQRKKVEKSKSSSEIQAERLKKAIEFTERIYLYLREIQAEFILKPSCAASLMFQSS